MLDKLKKIQNYRRTENSALAHETTNSEVLDFFALGGALRQRTEEDIIQIFGKAFCENETLALKTLFYFRDIRGGQGERRTFRTIIRDLAEKNTERFKPLVKHIPEYGRWDDLFHLINTPLEKTAMSLIKEQLEKDKKSENPTLLAKWLKSENTSSKESKTIAKITRQYLELKPRQYRVLLTELRAKIKVLEAKISRNKWGDVEYDKIPSKAGMQYRKAFMKHDAERYNKFLEAVQKGEKKINTKALFPYEIAEKVLYNNEDSQTLSTLWDNLPNYVDENENGIVVADTSGSMSGRPMAVSVSLAMYFAERNKGPFADHFITFSERPRLQKVIGRSLREKMRNLSNAAWDMNTNIEAVFKLILDTAVRYNVSQSELPGKIYIVSDMEFDGCTRNSDKTVFQNAKKMFQEKDYHLPEIVFWNVNARNTHVPVTINDVGVQLVSGCSPTIFGQLMQGKSAYDMMLEILNSKRYEVIQ